MEHDVDRGRLGTYLNDHLAGATLGARLARRSASANAKSDYGAALTQLADEIDEDRETLRRVIATLDLRESTLKQLAGRVLERAGTLKLNGRFFSYSPLSRLLELEGLLLGAMGKRCLWQTLEVVAATDPRLGEFDFSALQARAGRHVSRLGQLRLDARLPAFAAEPAASRETVGEEAQQPELPFSERAGWQSYTGDERRSGQERRMRHISPPSASDRRIGAERRVGNQETHATR